MKKIGVMIAGLSEKPEKGKMAWLVARAIGDEEDMFLCPYGLSENDAGPIRIDDRPVTLYSMEAHADILKSMRPSFDLVVDFTQPAAVNRNAELYCAAGVPFVMGTTGGDRKKLIETIEKSSISAIPETNFSPWVNVVREMFRFAGKNFPGAFKGGKRLFKEGHQPKKPDPSGTMISVLPAFEELFGEPINPSEIRMVRDALVQELEYGVPERDTTGCGYHMYRFRSANGAVDLNFEHNIRGRNDYVDGVLKAIRFLAARFQEKGKVFSMVDVLRG